MSSSLNITCYSTALFSTWYFVEEFGLLFDCGDGFFRRRYEHANILIHEATFLTRDEIEPDNAHRNKHSSLDAVMEMVADGNIGSLILGHFSSRYADDEIDAAIDLEKLVAESRSPSIAPIPTRSLDLSCDIVFLPSRSNHACNFLPTRKEATVSLAKQVSNKWTIRFMQPGSCRAPVRQFATA